MRRPLIAIALAALAVPGAVQAAQSSAPAAPVAADARLGTARRILELTNPYDQMVQANMVGWESAARKALSLDAASMKLETAYPGLFDAALAAARPLARKYLGKVVRDMLEYKAQVLAQRLGADELTQVLRFFSSDVGRKAISGLYANIDPAKIGTDIAVRHAETGSGTVTTQETQAIEQAAAGRMMGQVTAEQQIEILRFSGSATGTKFSAAGREADVKLIEMVNHPDPAWMAEQQQTMRAAAVAFVDSRRKK
jgi:hypothetical protein